MSWNQFFFKWRRCGSAYDQRHRWRFNNYSDLDAYVLVYSHRSISLQFRWHDRWRANTILLEALSNIALSFSQRILKPFMRFNKCSRNEYVYDFFKKENWCGFKLNCYSNEKQFKLYAKWIFLWFRILKISVPIKKAKLRC